MENPNPPFIFGEWVKRRRKALDLTQKELALRAGCSVFAVRKIESGDRKPSKQLAALLARSLEIPSEELPTFIRVARGETNLERLRAPSLEPSFATMTDPSTQLNAGLQPASVSSRIPLQPTQLIGRDSELVAMERLFNDRHCRLLTLTGMGGIGKTRLAIEFTTRQQLMFPAGVFYIPLASINSAEAIVPAVADVFGYAFSGPKDPKEQLINYISLQLKQQLLLVLDNLEHLLVQSSAGEKPVAVELISELLQRLPNIKILVTSRERLNLQGEWTYELHGLAVPPQELSGSLEDYSSVALFIQSAYRVSSNFEITETEQPALIKICQLLDGTPLALELAAAWVGMLSCQEIAQEINSNIDFLTTSMHDIPDRHRSLKASFDHSWKLLSENERDALSRLSIFRGGFNRNAAKKIAGASLPLLTSLVSKSLVRRTHEGRYDLHEVIRQFAASHLEEDQLRCFETCDLHSDYYLNLAFEYEKKLKSASQQDAVREMNLEFDNIRTAWAWGVECGKFETLGKAVRAFGWFFEVAGLLHDGIDHLELLIKAFSGKPRDTQMDRVLGLSLVHQGLLYFRSGQFVQAKKQYDESITILRSVGDQSLLADALIFDGTIAHLNGDYPESMELLKEGLECAQAANDQWFSAYGIYNMGHVYSLIGEYQKGYERMLEGIKIWRKIGDPHSISLGLNFLVPTQIKLGRFEEAKTAMRESISLSEGTKNRWGMGTAYRYLGLATLAGGQYFEAQDYFNKSLEIFGKYYEGWDIAISLIYLGDSITMAGDISKAKKIYLEGLRIAKHAQSVPLMLNALMGLARLDTHVGKYEDALGLSHFILNNPSSTQEIKDQAIEVGSKARKMLTDTQIKISEDEALDRTIEETVSLFTFPDTKEILP